MVRSKIFTLLLILPFLTVAAGCSDDDDPTGPKTASFAETWAGVYDSQVRWGGASGNWQNSSTLTIQVDGVVRYGGSTIQNPTIEGDQLSWSRADGNTHDAEFTFHDGHSSDFFWRDRGGSVTEKVFTGWRQSTGDGPLDFRGMPIRR